jgi:hypothetical protein
MLITLNVNWWSHSDFIFLLMQGHWPFPRDKIMMGYAYILTHPGTVSSLIFGPHSTQMWFYRYIGRVA